MQVVSMVTCCYKTVQCLPRPVTAISNFAAVHVVMMSQILGVAPRSWIVIFLWCSCFLSSANSSLQLGFSVDVLVHAQVRVHMRVLLHMRVCICACARVNMCVCVYVCVCVCERERESDSDNDNDNDKFFINESGEQAQECLFTFSPCP